MDEIANVPIQRASETIRKNVLSWSGVTGHPHRFGGMEYWLGRREIGHIHGDYLVYIPFPLGVRNQLVAEGRAEPHHVLPKSGWVTFYIKHSSDVERAVALLGLSFELAGQASR